MEVRFLPAQNGGCMRNLVSKDKSRDNLEKLIEMMSLYRDMQYRLFEQYNLVLEDPKFDTVYLNIETIMKYRKYIESDLNGTQDHSSTTQIIKEFKQLLESYDYNLKNYHNPEDGNMKE